MVDEGNEYWLPGFDSGTWDGKDISWVLPGKHEEEYFGER